MPKKTLSEYGTVCGDRAVPTEWVVACVLLTVVVGVGLGHAKQPDEIPTVLGWVERIDCPRASVSWERHGTAKHIELYAPVERGDVFSVADSACRLMLRLDGNLTQVSARNSPYRVDTEGRVPDRVSNALRWLASWLEEARSDMEMEVSAKVRGACDLRMPLLLGRAPKLIDGQRTLAFVWMGGVAPYQVSLSPLGEGTPRDSGFQGSSDTPRILGVAKLTSGAYAFRIADRNSCAFEARFEIVPASAMPAAPAVVNDAVLPVAVRQALRTAWLTSIDDGHWTLEAYQYIAASDAASPLATLRDLLEAGQRPRVAMSQ